MNIFKFLISKSFLIHLALVIAASIVTVLVVFKWMGSYTNHGESITLNDLTGLSLTQTIGILEDKKLTYEVIDTNTFDPNLPKYSIISQNPLPLDKVKEGRTVYLYVSTNEAPMIEIPFLAGKASQEAGMMKLRNAKFKIGEIFFKPSDSEGDILALMIDSVEVKKGQQAPEGTVIQLVVGGGLGGGRIQIPCLIGKTLQEVEFVLGAEGLNIGHISYGESFLPDTASAVIYKQLPSQNAAFIRMGEPIDIFLKQELPFDVNKCVNDTL